MNQESGSIQSIYDENEEFRNSLATMDAKGKRQWIFARKPKGKFTEYRRYVSWVLLAILFITPFLRINGNPVLKLDILKREFFILGYPFFTSDFFLLALGLITTVVFICLFTVVYGRIFCGWICPQTIFLEMVFRPIEYAIEGDRNKQIRLSKQKWDEEKIRKRLLKWSIYAVLSFLIANIFLAYIIGSDALIDLIVEGPSQNLGTFFGVLAFTGAFYFVFTWFREQACTLVCPYGRLQGVLIDKKTIVVAYDYKRGEREQGRGKFRRGENRKEIGKGDCIDCGQCVAVCPTGIDIRNGTQLECVNCTACIDACDEVMEKIDLPKGLIRYASEENIEKGTKFKWNARIVAYSAALVLLLVVLGSFLFLRPGVELKMLRAPGKDYIEQGNYIMNEFQFQLSNKTNETQRVKVRLTSHQGQVEISTVAGYIAVQKADLVQGRALVKIPKSEIDSYKERVVFELVNQEGEVVDTYETSFAAPF